MTEPWRSPRKKLSVAAALATVLAASGVGLVGPSSALAADTSTTPTEPGDATRHDWASDDNYFHNPHRDTSYVRFRVCPKTDNAPTTGTSVTPSATDLADASTTTTTSTGTAAASSPTDATTSTATPGPNDDVIADDPVFVLLPVKKERAQDYRRPERRRDLCYDLDKQQLVNVDDTTTATPLANAGTAPTVTDLTTPITPTPTTTTSTAPPTGG
jgi:hypothetical protein